MNIVAQSNRIYLREFEPGDAEPLHPVFSDPEAVLLCAEYLRSSTRFPRAIALIQAANAASVRVAEKAGMKYQHDTVFERLPMRVYAI